MRKHVSGAAKRCKGFMRRHKTGAAIILVILGVITVISFFVLPLVIVQYLFRHEASEPFFQAKWSAGDALSYFVGFCSFLSTAVLSGVAIWQNKRFKQENDVAQERLEKLTRQANEQAIVNKIIEMESSNLSKLENVIEKFSKAGSLQSVESSLAESLPTGRIDNTQDELLRLRVQHKLMQQSKELSDAWFELTRCLATDGRLVRNDKDPFKMSIANFYTASKKLITDNKMNRGQEVLESSTSALLDAQNEFTSEREKYLRKKHMTLNKVIYGNLPLDKIKEIYYWED